MKSAAVPLMKFRSEVAKLWFECSFICPFSARCTPTMTPARVARATAKTENVATDSRSQTEINTATTVIIADAMRRFEINFLPPPVNPIRSTIKDIAVCPAIDATE